MKSEITTFLAHCRVELGFSPATVSSYATDLSSLIKETGPDFPAAKLTAEDLRAHMRGLAQRKLSAATCARHLAAVKKFMAFVHNPAGKDLDRPRLPQNLPRPLPEADIAAMRAAAASPREAAVLCLLWACGLRASELCSLRVGDVPTSPRGFPFIRVIGKGNKERIVPLADEARESIIAMLESEQRGANRGEPLFVGMDRREVWRVVRSVGSRAGVPSAHPHRLRHSFATRLVAAGADIRVVQEMMGHADVTTTQQYTKVDPRRLRDVIEKCLPREQQSCRTDQNSRVA